MMEYKSYLAKVEFDDEAALFHGEVINTRDVVTFQGKSVGKLKQAFHDSVDDYLAFCEERGEAPDKPCSGQFLTRVTPELHRQVSLAASVEGKSLNAWVQDRLQAAVEQTGIAAKAPARKKVKRAARSVPKAQRKTFTKKQSRRRSADA